MGMMSANEMPQGVPRQGMMGGQSDSTVSHGKFNGTVSVNGEPVTVQNGVAEVEGQKYLVSDNGAMVVDGQGNLIGRVEGDQFIPVDEAYLKQMRDAGYVE